MKQLTIVAIVALGSAEALAQPATQKLPPPNAVSAVTNKNIDPAAFAEWVDGKEASIAPSRPGERDGTPQWVLWTDTGNPGHHRLNFGDSRQAGPRHLRIGFHEPVTVGTVMALGGGQLSVLKSTVTYPGNMADETQWTPAERLVNGTPSQTGADHEEIAWWVLPPGTQTRALRFTHVAQQSHNSYAGQLGGTLVFAHRYGDVAGGANVTVSSNGQKAAFLTDGVANMAKSWENDFKIRQVISEAQPEWVMLTWPQPQKLSALLAISAGFGEVEIQSYQGPQERHPRDGTEADWQTVQTYTGLQHGYPTLLWPNCLDFRQQVSTRGIRMRLLNPTQESHPHLVGNTQGGKRVWLGEVIAVNSLQDAPLQAVPVAPKTTLQAPIPIKFTLNKPGYVTLVIEKPDGMRVRNLVSETYFPAGENTIWWDGTNDLGHDIDAAKHGLYKIPVQFVTPGEYQVRGLVRDEIDLRYEFGIYTAGKPAWPTQDRTGAWLANHSAPQAALFLPAEVSPAGQPVILLGSAISEGQDGLAWVGLEGKKLGGKGTIGGLWTGAPFMARDTGPNAVPGVSAYVAAAFNGELRVSALDAKIQDKPVLPAAWKFPGDTEAQRQENMAIGGIAARDGVEGSG